jgi:hypothetical protein
MSTAIQNVGLFSWSERFEIDTVGDTFGSHVAGVFATEGEAAQAIARLIFAEYPSALDGICIGYVEDRFKVDPHSWTPEWRTQYCCCTAPRMRSSRANTRNTSLTRARSSGSSVITTCSTGNTSCKLLRESFGR